MTASVLTRGDVPVLIGGQWLAQDGGAFTDVHNPSTGETIALTPICGAGIVDQAVEAAKRAFVSWSNTPAPARADVMFKYRSLLSAHFDELAKLVTRENGKTLDEARGDVKRGMEVVELSCGIAHLLKGEIVPQIAQEIDGLTTREPIGVCAGITPFNFPAMVPMWMYPLAIACGNTFILKPSEKVPLTALRLAELFLEAGLPEGVLNVVHGGREVVDAICTHPDIAAVSFVGSSGVAQHVYTLGCQHGKRVQAAGGAKNVLVVMADADPDPTLRAIMGSAYGCAGQRCMAGSLLVGVGEAADGLQRRVVEAIDALKVGNTSDDPSAQMGPVIDEAARDRVRKYIDTGLGEGATLARDGRALTNQRGFFVGPTLLDNANPDMKIAREEIFGPVLTMLRPKSLEEAIEWANRSGYGNGATIFTSSGRCARDFARGVQCGMIGVNIGVPAPMAVFSFSGWNRSFYGDLHVQGTEGVMFYTRQKLVLSRWDKGYQRQFGW
ncbi:MAG TPA: CoA-acylating methylmalonate-semialdehyde dehydrogenase [Verrucomicrobiae bacterium]|nr:CoA-acylating methylmalonate-semialdehyde dehydrogenase [Verrucomicrobiae bacterium]